MTSEIIETIKTKIDEVGEYLKSVCIFTKQIGFNNASIRAKYALLPLLYYSYKREIKLDNTARYIEDRKKCGVFLKLSLIKGLFGGTPDSVLTPIRTIINESTNEFSFNSIYNSLVGKTKNLRFR